MTFASGAAGNKNKKMKFFEEKIENVIDKNFFMWYYSIRR